VTDAVPRGASPRRSAADDADRRAEARSILLVGGAIGVVAAAYLLFLRHRTDYPGHLLAGYGATLGALGLATLAVPRGLLSSRAAPLLVVAGTVVSVGVGAALEGSVFRIAQFDLVDFFNQSIGAALAGLSTLVVLGRDRPPPATRAVGALLGVAALAAGFLLAFH